MAQSTYNVKVNGSYYKTMVSAGDRIVVTDSIPIGKIFDYWDGTDGITFTEGNANTYRIEFNMPANNVNLTSYYIDATYTYTAPSPFTFGRYDTGITLAPNEYVTMYQISVTGTNGNRNYNRRINVTSTNTRFYVKIRDEDETEEISIDNAYYSSTNQEDHGTSSKDINTKISVQSSSHLFQGDKIYLDAYGTATINGVENTPLVAGDFYFCYAYDAVMTISFVTAFIEQFSVTVTNGSGSGAYGANDLVSITANTPPSGKIFSVWTGTTGLTFTSGGYNTSTATFIMPSNGVSLTAEYVLETFAVTVTNGSGSGSYSPGDTVEVIAGSPPSGKEFDSWTGATGLTFVNGNQNTAYMSFTMPSNDVSLTATYRDIPSTLHGGRYNGTGYQKVIPMYYDGTNWIECEAKYYDGANWIDIDAQ